MAAKYEKEQAELLQSVSTKEKELAELERENIKARQMAGIERARAEGKNLGREKVINDDEVRQWRQANSASIKATAEHFGISTASVKRAFQGCSGRALAAS